MYNNRIVECKTRCLCIRIMCIIGSAVLDNAVWWARWPLRAAMVTIARAPTGVAGVARDPCVSSRRDDHGRDPRRCRCRHCPSAESHVCPRPPPWPNFILPPLHYNAIMCSYAVIATNAIGTVVNNARSAVLTRASKDICSPSYTCRTHAYNSKQAVLGLTGAQRVHYTGSSRAKAEFALSASGWIISYQEYWSKSQVFKCFKKLIAPVYLNVILTQLYTYSWLDLDRNTLVHPTYFSLPR